MAQKMRFGIVGCGVIAPTHADAIRSLANDAELVAVTDELPERASVMGERYGVRAYSDLAAMLAEEQLDVVDVCTPSGLHGRHACQIMQAGCHVVVEKPMEISTAAIEMMLRVQADTGRKMTVISQHRFDEASQHVHALVAEGAFGRLVLGNAHIPWWRSQKYYDSGAWRGTWALDGGGVLMNQSVHSVDVLQWLMGRVVAVTAYTGTLAHSMETEDVAVAILRFANGALGTINATTGAYPGVTTRIDVFGDKGSAVIENDRLAFLHLASQDSGDVGAYGIGPKERTAQSAQSGGTAADPGALSSNTHALQIADLIQAIRTDGTPLLDGHGARHPVDIILAVYESQRTGREVRLS